MPEQFFVGKYRMDEICQASGNSRSMILIGLFEQIILVK